jgi:hypothetical protein
MEARGRGLAATCADGLTDGLIIGAGGAKNRRGWAENMCGLLSTTAAGVGARIAGGREEARRFGRPFLLYFLLYSLWRTFSEKSLLPFLDV